eukprot:UN5090
MRAWLEQQRASISPKEAADVMHWASLARSPARSAKDIDVPKLLKGCKVTVLYSEKDKEDEHLTAALKANGLKPNVRIMGVGETVIEGLVEEVHQALGDSYSPEADDE